jgi:hydroxyacylglutathione hydrolase
MELKSFTFSPFAENTYVLFDDTSECVIVDPGCYSQEERNTLTEFISEKELKPVALLNTHCHLDHIFGNKYIANHYNIPLFIHEDEQVILDWSPQAAMKYGLMLEQSPEPDSYYKMGENFSFGNTFLEMRFTPGHSPGSITFIHHKSKTVISGDVLFNGSIGRTDLPGGDMTTLLNSIENEIYTLPDDYIVHSGHGPSTSVAYEKMHNPFIRNNYREGSN